MVETQTEVFLLCQGPQARTWSAPTGHHAVRDDDLEHHASPELSRATRCSLHSSSRLAHISLASRIDVCKSCAANLESRVAVEDFCLGATERRTMQLPLGSSDVEDIFRRKPVGEPVNVHVVERVKEPKPDFEAMKRIIEGHSVDQGKEERARIRNEPEKRKVPANA